MNLSEASLTVLVAELRERLRRFAASPAGDLATEAPGPTGRASLAARLLAVVLSARRERDATQAARAFEELAEALATAPAPLPGSAWEADLGLLARTFETIAGFWDHDNSRELAASWRELRTVGDRMWLADGADVGTVVSRSPRLTDSPLSVADRSAGSGPRPVVWLLVAGALRRGSLRKRLVAAGLEVDCPADIAAVTSRLVEERPAALICDDAEPTRYRSHLLGHLPDSAPPVILVRSRTSAVDPGGAVWLPPYDTDEVLAHLRP